MCNNELSSESLVQTLLENEDKIGLTDQSKQAQNFLDLPFHCFLESSTSRNTRLSYSLDYTSQQIEFDVSDFFEEAGYALNELNSLEKWQGCLFSTDKNELSKKMREFYNDSSINTYEFVYRFKRKKGSYLLIKDTGFINRNSSGGIISLRGFVTDITEEKSIQLALKIYNSYLLESSGNQSLEELFSVFTSIILEYSEMNIGEIWIPLPFGDEIILSNQIFNQLDAENFLRLTDIQKFRKGEGLPGYVWSTQSATYWEEELLKKNFVRYEAARNSGLKNGYGFPVFSAGRLVAILCLIGRKTIVEDELFLRTINTVTRLIGPQIEKIGIENNIDRFFELSPGLQSILSPDAYFLKISESVSKILGYESSEILRKPIANFIYEPDDSILTGYLSDVKQGIERENIELRFKGKDEKIVWILCSSSYNSKMGYFLLSGKDITSRKEFERVARQTHAISKVGGWEYYLNTQFLYFTASSKRVLGFEPHQDPSKDDILMLIDREEDRDYVLEKLRNVYFKGEFCDIEVSLTDLNGKNKVIRFIGEREFYEEKVVRIYGSIQDVTTPRRLEKNLEESRNKLKNINDNIPGGVISYQLFLDGTEKVRYLSSGKKQTWGIYSRDIMKNPDVIWNVIHAEDVESVKAHLEASLSSGEDLNIVFRVNLPEDEIGWLKVNGIANIQTDGSCIWDALILDITKERFAEQQLEESNMRFYLASKAAREAIYELDLEKNLIIFSEGYQRMFGYKSGKSDYTKWTEKIYKSDRLKINAALTEAIDDPQENSWTQKYRIVNAGGKLAFLEDVGFILRNREGKALKIIGTILDITEREQFNEKLIENSIKSQENERNRVALELHDGIVQEMVGCSLLVERVINADSEQRIDQLNTLKDYIDAVTADTRQLSHKLYTADVEKSTLYQLMHNQAIKLKDRSSPMFDFSINIDENQVISADIKTNIYRVTQELCTNILKHSDAKEAHISLDKIGETLFMTVRDDGSKGLQNDNEEGIGLKNVRNRIENIGGIVTFQMADSGGFIVNVEVPL